MVTLSTFFGLPVSTSLGAISLARVSVSGIASTLTKMYQKKLAKVTKLTDIVTLALAMFKTSVSKVLEDGIIDERDFNMLQTLHLEVLNDLSSFGRKMAAETRSQFEKVYWKESTT